MNLGEFDNYIDNLYQQEEITLNDFPIDMNKIAVLIFGIELRVRNGLNNNLESAICFNSNECFIFYNDEFSEDKINLDISHEIVHYIQGHKTESQNHYKKKMRHSACSIEIQTEKYSKALIMPRYLMLQMKNLHFSKKQIIEKVGLSNYKDIADKRFKELGLFQEKPTRNKQILLLENSLNSPSEIDLPYYSKNQHSEIALNKKAKQNIRINKVLAKNADFVINLSEMKIEGIEKRENMVGFINTQNHYSESDLLLLSKDLQLFVDRKIEKGYKVIGKIVNYFRIPKPIIITIPEKIEQLSLF